MALAQQSRDEWPHGTSAEAPRRPATRMPTFPDAEPATDVLERACAAIGDLRQRRVRLERDALERRAQFFAELAAADEAASLWQRRTDVVAEQFEDSQARLAELEEIVASATRRIDHAEASLTRLEQTAYDGNAAVHLYHDRIMAVFGTMDLG